MDARKRFFIQDFFHQQYVDTGSLPKNQPQSLSESLQVSFKVCFTQSRFSQSLFHTKVVSLKVCFTIRLVPQSQLLKEVSPKYRDYPNATLPGFTSLYTCPKCQFQSPKCSGYCYIGFPKAFDKKDTPCLQNPFGKCKKDPFRGTGYQYNKI